MNIKDITSCNKATQLISKSLEEELSFSEKVKLNLHLMMCRMCIKYRQQLHAFRNVLNKYPEAVEKHPCPEDHILPKEVKDRINKHLKENN